MTIRFVYFAAVFILFGQIASAQDVLDKVTVKFSLSTLPTLAAVGFDNPAGSWKVKYAMRVFDSETYKEDVKKSPASFKPVKLKTKYKKRGVLVAKGGFKKTDLSNDANKTFSTDLVFNDKVRQMLLSKDSYTFLFRVQYRLKSDSLKKRFKNDTEFPIPAVSNGSLDLADKTISVTITLERHPDGTINHSIY